MGSEPRTACPTCMLDVALTARGGSGVRRRGATGWLSHRALGRPCTCAGGQVYPGKGNDR
eukprot:4835708-Prymnesium_polylepis.1